MSLTQVYKFACVNFPGVQRILYACYDKVTDLKVEDEECQFIQGPDSEDVECERISCSALS